MKLKSCLVFLFLFFLFVPTAFADLDHEALEIFKLVNEQRQEQKLNELKWDDDLADLAKDYSKQMADGDFFSHTDTDGLSIIERVERREIKYRKLGENLYYCRGFPNFKYNAVVGWLKSPPHKQTMYNAEFNFTGVGVAEAADGGFYITQVFLKR